VLESLGHRPSGPIDVYWPITLAELAGTLDMHPHLSKKLVSRRFVVGSGGWADEVGV
jgi:hypothetical protein